MTAISLHEQRPPSLSYSSDEGESFYDPTSSSSCSLSSSVVSDRRDSLPTHFNALTIQAYSSSLPENYTIDHTSFRLQQQQQQQRRRRSSATAAAAATGGRTIRPMAGGQQQQRKFQQHSCEACGKVYKHPSCLAKHRWEHSEQWELTSKLLLTKHQQVQMLEAAAILVNMDRDSRRESHSSNDDEEAFWIDI